MTIPRCGWELLPSELGYPGHCTHTVTVVAEILDGRTPDVGACVDHYPWFIGRITSAPDHPRPVVVRHIDRNPAAIPPIVA